MNYPLKSKIEQLLDGKGETKQWLADEMGISRGTLGNLEIEKASLETVRQLSHILNFDFLKDYNAWRIENELPALSELGEPPSEYKKREDPISVTVTITGTPTAFYKGFAKLLKTIKTEGEKDGFAIE